MNESEKEIASEMHRWGRMTGVFSIIVMVAWLVLDTVSSADPNLGAVKSSLLWSGVVLAILTVVGMFGGFSFDYLAGHKR